MTDPRFTWPKSLQQDEVRPASTRGIVMFLAAVVVLLALFGWAVLEGVDLIKEFAK